MAKKSIYIETTIPSIIVARPSRDIGNLYRQEITKEFWEYERQKYDLYISQYVWDECERGDEEAAKKRLELIKDISNIPKTKEVDELAEEYFAYLNIPQKAKTDCSHLAICVISKMDVLLSWNLTHLGELSYAKVVEYNAKRNLWIPRLSNPETFMKSINLEEK